MMSPWSCDTREMKHTGTQIVLNLPVWSKTPQQVETELVRLFEFPRFVTQTSSLFRRRDDFVLVTDEKIVSVSLSGGVFNSAVY